MVPGRFADEKLSAPSGLRDIPAIELDGEPAVPSVSKRLPVRSERSERVPESGGRVPRNPLAFFELLYLVIFFDEKVAILFPRISRTAVRVLRPGHPGRKRRVEGLFFFQDPTVHHRRGRIGRRGRLRGGERRRVRLRAGGRGSGRGLLMTGRGSGGGSRLRRERHRVGRIGGDGRRAPSAADQDHHHGQRSAEGLDPSISTKHTPPLAKDLQSLPEAIENDDWEKEVEVLKKNLRPFHKEGSMSGGAKKILTK